MDAKPAFRSAFKSRRCLVPADGWFEWVREGGSKAPRFLAMADGSAASFAALWERWDGGEEAVESFTIITTKASPNLAHVHARQPAIVEPGRFDDWLDPDAPKEALLDMVRQPHPGPYEIRQVSRLVNNVGNSSLVIKSPI